MWFAQETAVPTAINFETTDVVVVTNDTGLWATLAGLWFLWLIYVILYVVAMWKVFEKADEAGWKALIPFYNMYTLFRISGRNGWGFLLLFIPLVNLVTLLIVSMDLAKHFAKSTVFGVVGLFFFSVIGFMILGYGDSKYVGEKHQ